MRISTPLGEYPFLFDRVERREGGIVVVGTVAGLESSVFLGREDLAGAARLVAAPVAVALGVCLAARLIRR